MLDFDPIGNPISRMALLLYGTVALLAMVAAPKRDRTKQEITDALIVIGGTMAAFATGNLLVVLAGWLISSIPMWRRPAGETRSWTMSRLVLGGGILALAAAVFWMAWNAAQAGTANPFSLNALRNLRIIDNPWIFGLVIGAALTRKSVVPLHSFLLNGCEHGSLITTMLYMNGHLGVYLVARLAMPLMPVTNHAALSPLADLALLSGAATAIMALSEIKPRRLLGLLSISQTSFLLAGLESTSDVGISGAMAYWVVVSLGTAGLFIVQRLLEVRVSTPLTLDRFHGFATRTPRLAAFFLVSALALVGLPGTVGFVAEDLLFHGTLETHPELGLILPVATALNAISLLRMFACLFMGRRELHVPKVSDALPRERWALTAALLVIVGLGLRPDLLASILQTATLTIP